MRELEIKMRFAATAAEIVEALREQGYEPGPVVTQADSIFAFSTLDVERPSPGSTAARIRLQGGRVFLTVKRRRLTDLDCEEYETEVADAESARQILLTLGLREIVLVHKTRCPVSMGTGVTACVDEVSDLGVFVEIELLGEHRTTLPDVEAEVARCVNKPYHRVGMSYGRMMTQRRR